jgi:murein L,D-transpeptidase YcbB/YkuD
MIRTRAASLWLGLGLAGLSTAGQATDGFEVVVPLPPEVVVQIAPVTAEPPRVSTPVVISLPPLPEVAVSVPPAQADIAVPDLPAVVVAVPAADLVPSRIEALLGAPDAPFAPGLRTRDREAITAAYAAAGYAPRWISAATWSERGRVLAAAIARAGEEGLDAADYAIPDPGATAERRAEADLRLSALAVLYARDARGARIEPSRLSRNIAPKLDLPDAEMVLAALADARDPGAALQAYNPPHEGYRALKAKLADLRADRDEEPRIRIPQGPALKIGSRDERVPLLRARLSLPGEETDLRYDAALAAAVAAFQKSQGLRANGLLNRQTVNALSSPPRSAVENEIVANLERWRWVPADLGERHIAVNVPEYKLRIVEGGRVVHEARAIVGKPERPTPIFSDAMDHIVVNPSWTIPPTILRKDVLPAMRNDPSYAARRGYEVFRNGRRVDPASVDWASPGGVTFRQPPGERNALGRIKFMFPNDFAVYIHDTPTRNLFSADRRALSSGCVRVDQPFQLAETVLGEEWSERRLKSLLSAGGERTIRLPRKIPVHLTYFTLGVDADGRLVRRDDVYGLDRAVQTALGLPVGHNVAKVAP